MLAYVFWHRPGRGGDPMAYETALHGFHAALADAPPAGYGGSCALALDAAPWLPGDGPAYEDWYLVEDWPGLGTLDAHAVAGALAAPHDAAARRAGVGTAGVYSPLAGAPGPPAQAWRAWLAKPPGMPYAEFHAALADLLPAGAAAWQRRMTLGPAGEYALAAPEPLELPWPATTSAVRAVVG
jgi:hypothetical protein